MKAAHMTVTHDGLTFQNGESYLVVTNDQGALIDMARWPGRPQQRPTTQDEMDAAVNAWFEQQHDEMTTPDITYGGNPVKPVAVCPQEERNVMKFYVMATHPMPEAIQYPDARNWLEASEGAETLEDAFAIIKQWVDAEEIEPYGHGTVTFHIEATPEASDTTEPRPFFEPTYHGIARE